MSGLFRPTAPPTLDKLAARDDRLAAALGDLEACAEELGETVDMQPEGIRLSHRLVAALPAGTAQALGLPPFVHLTLSVDAEGVPGRAGFRLVTEWRDRGRRVLPHRKGAILTTAEGPRRLPLWMLEAIEAAEGLTSGTGSEEAHWAALARFRAALDPALGSGDAAAARLAITDFLRRLEVRLADSFGIEPRSEAEFDVLPFDRRKLMREDEDALIEEDAAELAGGDLAAFQATLRHRGTLRAYRLGPGRYLAIDPGALPALEVMSEMARAPVEVRRVFLKNPRAAISRRVEERLRANGALDGLSDEGIVEAIETAARHIFVETRAYAERVLGVTPFVAPSLPPGARATTTWLPEVPDALAEAIAAWRVETLRSAIAALRSARDLGDQTVTVAGLELPVDDSLIQALTARLRMLEDGRDRDGAGAGGKGRGGERLVLETADNLERLRWNPVWAARPSFAAPKPVGLSTTLRPHQRSAFDWQVAAWAAGAPGILNADEQGLGKTLETLAFLRWLAEQPGSATSPAGPVLIVAPTSLLETWAGEAEQHLDARGLGSLVRLYGTGLARLKTGRQGTEIATGAEHLDLAPLFAAVDAGRGRDWWLLTTYDTLVNYQHSLARLPLAAVVFDEAQAIKNPATLRHVAARALKADFRIALTGTPIENTTSELWAILDVVAPGVLGSLRDYVDRFGTPDPTNMALLRRLLFEPQDGRPALALRRLKDEVAADLPAKTRRLHPVLMPPVQAAAYDAVRIELAGIADRGRALRVLHRLRTVALHPDLDGDPTGEAWADASARLRVAFAVLDRIRDRGERALIFLESRNAQHRLASLVQRRYGLARIDVLNGDTPIDRRRAMVTRFQRHLATDEGFDLMILGPRAAGVGLTLTAATHVIHLSRWWNPAVEEQCNDRIHRIGQTRSVEVHLPIAVHPNFGAQSFDCRLQALMLRKSQLSRAVLWPMGDTDGESATLLDELTRDRDAPDQSAERAIVETLEELGTGIVWKIDGETIVLG
ncbi:DEAD/DEAH box helicase [Rhodobaculum claviforme]|nr:DEAD/DEAH box helicase [Rhodobaculum claviforme]